jgi:asparagine synthase (glutamine-hydrolysing)
MPIIGYAGYDTSETEAVERSRYLRASVPSKPLCDLPAQRDGWVARAAGTDCTVSEGVLVAICGKPIWMIDDAEIRSTANAADALWLAYKKFDVRLLTYLHGAFAIAVLDSNCRRAMLAIDRMGIERMTYAIAEETITFGTSALQVSRFPGIAAEVSQQALFDYMIAHMIPAPRSVFEGVHKLRAGHVLVFEGGRATVIERYWLPTFVEYGPVQVSELQDALLPALEAAVRRSQPDERTGAFLSGGLDSSSVAGMLSRVQPAGARTFSIGFGVESYDEREYARIAAKHFGLKSMEYDLKPEDIITAIPLIAAAYDEPFGNSSAVPTWACARLAAANGITHLLAGDGGDELFGGNERYARQQVFEYFNMIPEPLRRIFVEPLVSAIPAEFPVTPLRKLRSYVDQARIPLPERLESWNYIYRTDLGAMLEPDFAEHIDTKAPLQAMKELYESVRCQTLLNKLLYFDWQYTLADNDLRKVGTMCDVAGVIVSYPMLDPAILELSLKIPSAVKMRGNRLRTFYKDAMGSFLPESILQKSKHGFGLPFGVWLKTHVALGELVYGLLSQLKRRRIVRSAFLDQLVDEHRAGHPSYFGYAIWDLALLEAWLSKHTTP